MHYTHKNRRRNKFVIFSTYLTSRYADSISTPTFENKGYSYVIDSDGKRIVGSSHNGSFGLTFDNLFDEMSQASSKNDSAIQQMQADLKEGKSDGIIMLNGIEKYIYYTPLNINDWYILTVVPKKCCDKVHNSNSYMLLPVHRILLNRIFLPIAYGNQSKNHQSKAA